MMASDGEAETSGNINFRPRPNVPAYSASSYVDGGRESLRDNYYVTVSYTHLDVYKRQALGLLLV